MRRAPSAGEDAAGTARRRAPPLGRAGLLLALACSAGAGPADLAAADIGRRDPDMKTERARRLGPFHVQPYFLVRQMGYDDNVLLAGGEGDGAFTATLGPGARAILKLGGRAALLLAEELDFVYIADHPELNHLNNGLRAKADYLLGPFVLYADSRRNSSRERLNAEVDFRVRTVSVGHAVGFRGDLSSRLSAGMQVARQDLRFGTGADPEEVLAGGADRQAQLLALRELSRTESGVTASVGYRVLPKTTVALEGWIGRADFDDPASGRDTRDRRLSLQITMAPSAALTGSVKVGRLRLKALQRDDPGFTGFVGEGSLRFRLSGRSSARVRYGRSVAFSTFGENLYFVATGWRLTYAHHLSRRWSFELEHGRDTNDYPLPLLQGPAVRLRRDDVTIDAASGLLWVKEGTRLGLRVEHWSRDSTILSDEVRRRSVSTFVEYNY
ncbi:MAG: outer membrane beta-barrel protein [Acidobacteria bacterium]|nr:outer membrane beta-barrel protein [Acidobacteriota bacterium]